LKEYARIILRTDNIAGTCDEVILEHVQFRYNMTMLMLKEKSSCI